MFFGDLLLEKSKKDCIKYNIENIVLKSNTKNKIFAIAGGLLVLLILAFALPTFATQIYGTYPSGGGGFSPPPCGNGVCASDETFPPVQLTAAPARRQLR